MALTSEQREWLTLALLPGVGSTHFIRLLARFHTAGNVLRASHRDVVEVAGKNLAERIREYASVVDVDAQERLMNRVGASVVTLEDQAYPRLLAEIYDPPLALFVRGELTDADDCCVAVVGTRRPTPYGIRMAEKLARELAARGITVVAGLAEGIDAAAHRGAIEGGGRTIAVLGNGVDVVYPKSNAGLMDKIACHGCVLSQFAMGVKPSRGHFPYRNRIISGLSLGTVIIEAPIKSGALITARHASEQGREVFAVPGQVGNRNSEGPHALIRDGSKLVESVEDILVELQLPPELLVAPAQQPRVEPRLSEAEQPGAVPPELHRDPARASVPVKAQSPPAQHPAAPHDAGPRAASAKSQAGDGTCVAPARPAPANITGAEKRVLDALEPSGLHVDEIAALCRIPISEALSSLTLLELKGLVRQFSGKRFAPR